MKLSNKIREVRTRIAYNNSNIQECGFSPSGKYILKILRNFATKNGLEGKYFISEGRSQCRLEAIAGVKVLYDNKDEIR